MVRALKGSGNVARRQPGLLSGRHRLHLRPAEEARVPVDKRLKGRARRRFQAAVQHRIAGVQSHGRRGPRIHHGSAGSLDMARLNHRALGAGWELRLRGFRQSRPGFGSFILSGPAQAGQCKKRGQKDGQADKPRPPYPAAQAGASFSVVYRYTASQRPGPRWLQVMPHTQSTQCRSAFRPADRNRHRRLASNARYERQMKFSTPRRSRPAQRTRIYTNGKRIPAANYCIDDCGTFGFSAIDAPRRAPPDWEVGSL